MSVLIAVTLVILAVGGLIAIGAWWIGDSRATPSRRLRGGAAIEDAIGRYDRRQRYNWYGRFWE